ncbi:helix-turn-helix transcriptional regulator [Halalkalicoccus salilacus]|uniref:helix-turn-helix transcriptional regulator n=1 Tax=Halalkalicoccus salilacus TaxID=3117459 RepID=UPI00300ED938
MIDQGEKSIDGLEFLARSQSRVRLLDALSSATYLPKAELRRQLDTSRTTVDRHLDALEERNWIRAVDDGYATTRVGELVAEEFFAFVETIRMARRLVPAMKWLPSEFDLNVDVLADAEVVLAEPHDPYSVMNHHVRTLRSADRLWGIVPLTGLHIYEGIHEAVVHNGASVRLIVGPRVAEIYQSDLEYRRLTEEMERTDRFELRVYDSAIPYGVTLLDGSVQIVGIDDEGLMRSLIETEAPRAREWAERVYRRYSEESRAPLCTF